MNSFSNSSNDTEEPTQGSATSDSHGLLPLSGVVNESAEKSSGYHTPPPYIHKTSDPSDSRDPEQGSSASNTFYAAPQVRVTVAPPVAMTGSGTLILAPPLSFSRPAPENLSYPSFEPTFLISRAKYLDKGFPLAPPPSSIHPHPFITRCHRS